MTTLNSQKIPIFFTCKSCDYETGSRKDYNKHLLTLKHENTTKYNEKGRKIPKNYVCECGKSYPYRASLYNHKKKCTGNPYKENKIIENSDNLDYKEMFITMIKENKELQTVLVTQQHQINELIPKVGNQIVGNNNIINNKPKFNINIFLNEQCKDALTMNEFIDKIKITMDDLMITKNKGLSEGVSNIFIENMNKLSLHERPMHCTDMKRETVYIKCDDECKDGISIWEKDKENKKLKKALKKVSQVQQKNLAKWTEKHPNWMENQELQEEYMLLVKNCTDDLHENKREEKVIKKVCNLVYLGDAINDV